MPDSLHRDDPAPAIVQPYLVDLWRKARTLVYLTAGHEEQQAQAVSCRILVPSPRWVPLR